MAYKNPRTFFTEATPIDPQKRDIWVKIMDDNIIQYYWDGKEWLPLGTQIYKGTTAPSDTRLLWYDTGE